MELNIDVYESWMRNASRSTYYPVISFVGPTGEGKSHILNEFLSLSDRLNRRYSIVFEALVLIHCVRGSIVAVPGQNEPNSCNVHLFKGLLNTMPINLIGILVYYVRFFFTFL